MSVAELLGWVIATFATGLVVGFCVAWHKIHEEERTEAELFHDYIHKVIRPLKHEEEDE